MDALKNGPIHIGWPILLDARSLAHAGLWNPAVGVAAEKPLDPAIYGCGVHIPRLAARYLIISNRLALRRVVNRRCAGHCAQHKARRDTWTFEARLSGGSGRRREDAAGQREVGGNGARGCWRIIAIAIINPDPGCRAGESVARRGGTRFDGRDD